MNKLRSKRITIELLTEDSPVWVRAELQRVVKDALYNTLQVVDGVGFVHREFSEFALQTIAITDPVTQQQVTVSGAGIALLIRDLVCQWMIADRGGSLNQFGDVIED